MNQNNQQTVEAFIEHLTDVQRRRPQTVRTYAYTLKHWIEHLADKPLSDVRPTDVEDWAARPRRSNDKPSASTMRREVVVVRVFQQWAHERGHGAATVRSAHAPSAPSRSPKPVDDADWLKVWRSDLRESDRLVLGLGYYAGLRRGEIVTLRPEDVTPETGTMRFIRKGGSPEPVEYKAMGQWLEGMEIHEGFDDWCSIVTEQVDRRLELGANLLWWEGIGEQAADSERLARRMRTMNETAGLDATQITLHRLRHSAATNLVRAGCPPELIRDALSHSSWDITSRYAKTSGQMERALNQRRQPQ
jgi:integrase/recombinase XerD